MKKALKEFLLYIIGFLILTIPIYLCYNVFMPDIVIPPLLIIWVVPIYLIVINLWAETKYKKHIPIWRILPCSVILICGYFFTEKIIENYFSTGYSSTPDSLTIEIVEAFYVVSAFLIAAFLLIQQFFFIVRTVCKRKKVYHKTVIPLLSSVLFTVALFCVIISMSWPGGSVDIRADTVLENSYNNSNIRYGGKLVRIENNLYYNYEGSNKLYGLGFLRKGLYRIGENGSKRVYSGGFTSDENETLFGLQVLENRIFADNYFKNNPSEYSDYEGELKPSFFGDIFTFNTDKSAVELFASVDIPNDSVKYYKIVDGKFYIFSDQNIYLSENGTDLKKVFSNLSNVTHDGFYEKACYISNDTLYYISVDNQLKKYSFLSQKEEAIIDLKAAGVSLSYGNRIIVKDDIIFFTGQTNKSFDVYSFDRDSLKKIYTHKLMHGSQYCDMNGFGDYLFFSLDDDGLEKISIKNGKAQRLVSENVYEVYVVDDEYVYYVTDDSVLKRVSQDGKTAEKVFG